jgi:predicted acyl esterase
MLTRNEPFDEPSDSFTYNPLNPVFTAGGRGGLAENGFIYGPVDQGFVERRVTFLLYLT